MERKEAIEVLYGDGTTRHNRKTYPLIKRLDANVIYLQAPGYRVQSAESEFHGAVLSDICEALSVILKSEEGIRS